MIGLLQGAVEELEGHQGGGRFTFGVEVRSTTDTVYGIMNSAASPLGEVRPLLQGHLILEACFSFCIPSVRAKIIAFQQHCHHSIFFLLPANPMVPAISRLRLSNSIVIGRDPNLGPADLPNKPLADLSSSNVFIFRWLKSGLRGARELTTTATLASIWNQKFYQLVSG